ncbi:MAG: exodeoxyribonuclease V subunit beta, partial [Chromatiaceae bacterium]|nr:exodeoxyribonuclease V subunit beta [Chromatiaceae bacterium]
FRAALYQEALAFMRAELARRKSERRQLAFDDLLGLVDEALAGARGTLLAARIRETYRHALIDEFQDTDSLQYRIFSRVYIENQGREEEALGLFLIGDPKQAIYAFRGADIFTYMSAGRVAAELGCTHGMDTNWRSTTPLIAAVNQIFSGARAPFIFAEDIRFEPVKPKPDADAEPLRLDGAPATGLLWRWLPITDANMTDKGERIRADLARHEAAADCAGEIAALLVAAGEGRARLGQRELRAGDIAVLVRSHREGRLIREALARYSISCVSIGRETVFTSEEAEELAVILAALRAGADEGALRRALATRLLGWSAADLAGLESDERRWSALLARFEGYRERWRASGCLSALERLVHQEGVAVRLRAGPDGERRLTNLLHLIELAQEAERQHPGIEGLEQWLADQRREADSGEGALLRLESDEALVRILTIHKSKGLEFPLVFLPFVYGANQSLSKPLAASEPFIFHDRERLDRCLDLGTDEPSRRQHLTLLREEALAEDLRLFYVAITRAKQRCVIHWGAVNHLEKSAAAYLLHQDAQGSVAHLAKSPEADLRADLVRLVAASAGAMRLENSAPARVRGAPPASVEHQTLAPAPFKGIVRRDWRILSYSGLVAGREDSEHPDHDALGGTASLSGRRSDPVDPIFAFPRGARAGECLHDLFEHLDFPEARGAALEVAVDGVLARHGLEAEWRETLIDWTRQVLDTPLDGQGLCLRQLTLGQRRNELEFHFALDGFEPRRLTRLLEQHGYPMLRLDAGRWQGLMKGFIDLVFRVGDRYYILDYKSNHLGDRLDDYGPEGLQQAMRAHRYHAQYLIYLVALHRYLGWRLPGYDYERHIGGVYYLFLRGMRPERGPERGVFHDRPPRDLIESLDACFGAALEEQP